MHTMSKKAELEGPVCFRCGYLLRGLSAVGVCPECGNPYNSERMPRMTRRPAGGWFLVAVPPLAMCAWLFLGSYLSSILGEVTRVDCCLFWLAGMFACMFLAKRAAARVAWWQYSRRMQRAIENGGPEPTAQWREGLREGIWAWEILGILAVPGAILFFLLMGA